jgi:hypothetical protein
MADLLADLSTSLLRIWPIFKWLKTLIGRGIHNKGGQIDPCVGRSLEKPNTQRIQESPAQLHSQFKVKK